MVLEDFIRILHNRTKIFNNDPALIDELNAALDETWKRLYVACPDLKITFETTGTFAADTQQFDLGAEIRALGGDVFYASKTFWIKGQDDQQYIPVVFMDVNDPRFIAQEQVSPAQVIQPVYASLVNYSEVRFAPMLPSGTSWRADWIGKPPNFSLATQCVTSIPEPMHQAILDYATASCFQNIDDSRGQDTDRNAWSRKAENKIISAIHAIKRRQNQTKIGTAPYPSNQAGYGIWPQG